MDISLTPLSEKIKLNSLNTVTDSNLLCFSEDFGNSKWGGYLGTKKLSATNILNPFGTSTVSAISGTASIYQDTIKFNEINSVGQYTFSIYVNVSSNTESSTISPTIWALNPVSCAAGCSFNVKTGKVLSTSGKILLDSYHSEYVGNGWYRYSITTTQISSVETAIRCEAYYNGTTALTGNLIAWGAQLEKGKNYGTYLKTSSDPKISKIEHNFVDIKSVEPALGLPFTKNHLTYSQTFSSWNSSNLTLSAKITETKSPSGTYDAYKLIPSITNTTHFISNTATVKNVNVPYTFSTFFKASAYRYAGLRVGTLEDNKSTYLTATADISAGTVLTVTGNNVFNGSAKITPYPNNWYRLSITGTYSSFKNFSCEVYAGAFAIANLTFSGNNNSYICVWGSQLEQGKKSTRYIKTNGYAKTGFDYTDIVSSTDLSSSYYFPIFAPTSDKSIINSRRFTGSDTLFLSGGKLSYNNKNPKYDLDISGTFHALSAYIPTLSTNNIGGDYLTFEGFDSVQVNSDVVANKGIIFNYLSANNVTVTSTVTSLSSRFDYISVPSISANRVFSSINWNLTAGGTVSAKKIKILGNFITPYTSSPNAFFHNLSADIITVTSNLTSISALSASYIHGKIQIDPNSLLYYQDGLLCTKLSASYFFGVKPSDVYSTDNINIFRSLTGNWDGSNGSIIETLPVYKPYFKNIKQVFDYVGKYNLYGDSLNVLIYDDICQDNINNDGTVSESGCVYGGNLVSRFYKKSFLPTFMQNAGMGDGDYVWCNETNVEKVGKISYWGVDRSNFKNIFITGMYEIGTVINASFKKQYIHNKPFNYSPRKISFNTYVCSDNSLGVGFFGADQSAWTSLYTNISSNVVSRQVYFNGDEMDVNIQNLCFEFNCNNNDSTCLYFKSGNSYLSNVTVAALGAANYSHGAVLAWPKSNVYICGLAQIDPYLLSPTNWSKWNLLKGATNQNYYPGYGLTIVGNPTAKNIPTLFSNCFIKSWKSNIFIQDYSITRRIGNGSLHNASIILDGDFSSTSFYQLNDNAKIHTNNYIFKGNGLKINNYDANIYDNSAYGGKYLNVFESTNRDNFYYVNFVDSFSTFVPNYYELTWWTFKDSDIPNIYYSDISNISLKLVTPSNPNYIFDENTKNICLSGMLFNSFQKNSLRASMPLNDNTYLYKYIAPSELQSYNNPGLYNLTSPIDNTSSYILNYYSSGGQTINIKI